MRGTLKIYGIKKVFILGAGFSAPFGMPLTHELLALVYNIALEKQRFGEGGKPIPYGMASWLVEELKWYFPTENFCHSNLQKGLFPEKFDVEKFLSYVYATSAFGEQWDEQGDQFVSFLRKSMGEAIYKEQVKAFKKGIPETYQKFIDCLKASMVITFNWDTLLETLLDINNKSYSYDFAATYETKDIPIIKLHGSIDWFSNFAYKNENWMEFTPIYRGISGIEKNGEFIYEEPVLFKAAGNLLSYYNKAHMSPRIIAPSYDKLSQATMLGDLWRYPWMFLQDKLEVIIIGFSMRPDDYHSRAFIYPQLVQGSRDGNLRVKVIDYAVDSEKKNTIKKRFAGVENIEFWFEGFNKNSLDFINK